MSDQIESAYDGPWKEVIEELFPAFMTFYFPRVAAQIDWQKPFVFLDKELQQLTRASDEGRRYVDKLVRVTMLDGDEEWLLIHIEVQGKRDSNFPKRMFVYNYRIFERYGREVLSLAVLGDLEPDWRPNRYAYGRAGSEMGLTFPIAKLLDIEQEIDLECSDNPFALATLAHLQAKRTRTNADHRVAWKKRLSRAALHKGFDRRTIFNLMKFIDWVISLPEALDKQIKQALNEEEEAAIMTYIPSFLRDAHNEGKLEGELEGKLEGKREILSTVLEQRFGALPEWARTKVAKANEKTLDRWSRVIFAEADSLEQFFAT